MKHIVKILAAGAACVIIVWVEAALRANQGGSLLIDGLPIEHARVTGKWQPDFLWVGKAWWIDIESEVPLRLRLDEWQGEIPKGTHKIYSNHDGTNTGAFGDTAFSGFPKKVQIGVR
jgi:hypothetical protein